MADPIALRTGPSSQSDGSVSQARGARTGELAVSQTHGQYYEPTFRGNVYSACATNGGVAPSGTASTTASFTLYNPVGSGKRLVLQKVFSAYLSGTYAAGPELLGANTNPAAAAPTGTAIVPVNRDLGAANNSVAKPFYNSTLPVAPTTIEYLWSLGAFAGGSVPTFVQHISFDGDVVIEPGCSVSIQSITSTGTNPASLYGMTWEEVPI